MLQSESVKVLTLSDLGLVLVPDETGTTFEENATIKATEVAALLKENGHSDFMVIADDSGIEIDAMGKKPGVDSANFLGTETPFVIRNAKILEMLEHTEERTARFVSVIACALPCGETILTRATIEGVISHEQKGENGFGYDPIFFLPELGKMMAELSDNEKNKISHRGKSLEKMVEALRKKGLLS
ncbi:MAG: RdgB/HAM1 family non-canonical purine NTP pyrophosphatase [Defluviitaleaceae bacterium]|nr:RdgB/HAM1 family non-canonical purine NTP pyrophosphatase [Defluviitaleaceae bacterium]MCL2263071.1 RdgB/HAM1 family non-canonical purine NTP pyrophosphatase [Defluviitaleaceae bacterium]